MKKKYLIATCLMSAFLSTGFFIFLMLQTNVFRTLAATTCTLPDNLLVKGNINVSGTLKRDGYLALTTCRQRISAWADYNYTSEKNVTATVSCADDEVLTGGGGHCENKRKDHAQESVLRQYYPDEDDDKKIIVVCSRPDKWNGSSDAQIRARAYAICCKQQD